MLDSMQRARVLHTDIKPDNFLLAWPELLSQRPATAPSWSRGAAELSAAWSAGCVQLIDFGRAIDLDLLGAGTLFVGPSLTTGLQCPEMIEGKPWHYGVRSTCTHCACRCLAAEVFWISAAGLVRLD